MRFQDKVIQHRGETSTSSSGAYWRSLLSKIRTLSARELLLVARMLGLVAALQILQRCLSLPHLVQLFDVQHDESFRPSPSQASVPLTRATWLMDALLRRIHGSDFCMTRSLVLFRVLRTWGYDVSIHFGATKADGSLCGHAWLELDNRPLAEAGSPQNTFAETYVYPSSHVADAAT